MPLSKRSKDLVAIVGVIILVGTASAGVVKYFEEEKKSLLQAQHDIEIIELKKRVGTIERRLGGDVDFLDVQKLWADENYISDHLPTSKYYSGDGFYASNSSTSNSDWTYEETTDHAVSNQMFVSALSSQISSSSNATSMHIWRGTPVQEVAGSDIYRVVFPHISLTRIPLSDFLSEFQKGLREGIRIAEDNFERNLDVDEKIRLLDLLENYFTKDITFTTFVTTHSGIEGLKLRSNGFDYQMRKLQKIGNVLYVQYIYTLSDVSVGEKKFKDYYIYEEMILILTEKNLFFLTTSIPTDEIAQRNRYFGHVTQWLGEFAILREW